MFFGVSTFEFFDRTGIWQVELKLGVHRVQEPGQNKEYPAEAKRVSRY
jgi:hypothetical protein